MVGMADEKVAGEVLEQMVTEQTRQALSEAGEAPEWSTLGRVLVASTGAGALPPDAPKGRL